MAVMEQQEGTAFHWNGGAWFGAQFGGTLWLLVGAGFLLRTPALAGLWFGCFALANGAGIVLWRRRDRIGAHSAFQILLGVLGACALVALVVADVSGRLGVPGGVSTSRWTAYPALLVFPLLMLIFAMRERAARRAGTAPSRS